ncbi:hypothetical protein [Dongia sedimenti]|uniref:Uncharacterized protein n=1 Tax=Dongia sedimenti TaxID=3064282 RepID=A0ABU0YS09_9PROT|nr:hypothetical protein [Rhodospirillaceae bacterium R-7]
MSVIIALRAEDGRCSWLGCDTMVTGGNLKQDYGPKWLLQEDWAIGVAGHLRTVNLVEHHIESMLRDLNDPYEFALRVREIMKSDGYRASEEEIGPLTLGGALMLARPHGAWVIEADFSITPIAPGAAWAEGSGREVCMGALHVLLTSGGGLAPRDIVQRALDAAMALEVNCGGRTWIHQLG